MIQPLKPARNSWIVEWSQFDEDPVLVNGNIFLPVVVLVVDVSELEIIGHLILPEIDQRQIQALLTRLLQGKSSPSEILMPARKDWNQTAWSGFAADFHTSVEFYTTAKPALSSLPEIVRMTRRMKGRFARQILAPLREKCSCQSAEEVAEGLLEICSSLYSQARRCAHLEAALAFAPQHARILLALADHHFERGKTDSASQYYSELLQLETRRWKRAPQRPAWWLDPETRPIMRARYGLMMCECQRGEWDEALNHATTLLKLNPNDNQGARFLIPLLYLLADNLSGALDFFHHYEKNYPNDYHEPSFHFAWGLTLAADGQEERARHRYRQAILHNLYVAPILLDLPTPPSDLWHPSERSEPDYAYAFCDSYGILWERDHAALRFLRDTYEQMLPEIDQLVALRRRMADLQDERYDPNHKEAWEKLVAEEKLLLVQKTR